MKNYRYDPVVTGLFAGIGFIVLWYFSSLAIEQRLLPKYFEYIIRFFTVLLASLSGAFAAFRFNARIEDKKNQREEDKKVKEKVAILNRALLNIALQLNAINNIKNLLSRYPNIHDQAFKMPAEMNFNEKISVDVNEISLILSDYPQLLMEISVEQDAFILTVESLKVRHEHFIRELQPKMNELGLLDRKCTVGEYEDLLPYHIFKGSYDSVNLLVKNVNDSKVGLRDKFSKLRNTCKECFPQHKFMQIS